MVNTVPFWAKKLMEIWYLLITEKFFFWTFREWEIGLFLSQKVDGKMIFTDYWKRSCVGIFGDGKYSLFLIQNVYEKMIFTWSIWAFHDILRLGKYVLSCSDSMGGGLLLYIRDDILMKLLKHDFGTNIENLSVEIDSQKRKWFLNGSYNTDKNKISNHLNYLHLACSKYSKVYDDFIFMRDFNVPMHDKAMGDFCSLNNLESLI